MPAEDKRLTTMGLCYKAGKLILGFDAVCQKIEKNHEEISAVLLANGISEKTRKEILFITKKYHVEVVCTGVTQVEIL